MGASFISFLNVNSVLFVAKLFSFRHKGTKTLSTNNKIKSFVSLCLGGKYFLVPVCPGWAVIKKYLSVFYFLDRHVLTDPGQDLVKLIFEFGKGFSSMAYPAFFFSG